MKRDMDLVREILLRAEAADGYTVRADAIPGHEKYVVAAHMQLMDEAGLIVANLLIPESIGAIDGSVERLTWEGYDFLDAARSTPVWEAAKRRLGDTLGGIPFELMKPLLLAIAREKLGLPQ